MILLKPEIPCYRYFLCSKVFCSTVKITIVYYSKFPFGVIDSLHLPWRLTNQDMWKWTNIRRRLSISQAAFASFYRIWKSPKYSTRIKLRIFNTNIIYVRMYNSEMWRTTVADERKIDTFQCKCLRKIRKIHWPEKISNDQLYKRAKLYTSLSPSKGGDGSVEAIYWVGMLMTI